MGDRSEKTAQKLWERLPNVYRQCAVCYSDFWSAYQEVLPSKRHKAVHKSSGKTSYIERFNNTLRQRVSPLVRKTLSFSKKIENHLGRSGILYITIMLYCFLFPDNHHNAPLPRLKNPASQRNRVNK